MVKMSAKKLAEKEYSIFEIWIRKYSIVFEFVFGIQILNKLEFENIWQVKFVLKNSKNEYSNVFVCYRPSLPVTLSPSGIKSCVSQHLV